MFVRNFWIDAQVDGRSSLAAGPKSKSGGLAIQLRQRSEGEITTALTIKSWVTMEDKLRTIVCDSNGNVIYTYETER